MGATRIIIENANEMAWPLKSTQPVKSALLAVPSLGLIPPPPPLTLEAQRLVVWFGDAPS